MALRHSLGLEREAAAVEHAVDTVLADGLRTPDIAAGGSTVTTSQMGSAVVSALH
jgi:3-isopropylmalate dehydrogenase